MKNIIIIELAILGIFLFPTFTAFADNEIYLITNHLPINSYKSVPILVTAYNSGDEFQTDQDSPCVGAGNHNICQALDEGKIVFAANFLPLHTKICVEKIGCGEVLDRMAPRFIGDNKRIDVAMPKDKLKEAKQFGLQKLNYYCE